MTVLAACSDGKTWAIGSDSGSFDDDGSIIQTTNDPKIWRVGQALLGGSGSFRVIEIARKSGLADPFALRSHLQESNASGDWEILVVTRSALYSIGDDFAVVKYRSRYGAGGAASAVALGALCANYINRIAPKRSVEIALKVALEHSMYAAGPTKVMVLQ